MKQPGEYLRTSRVLKLVVLPQEVRTMFEASTAGAVALMTSSETAFNQRGEDVSPRNGMVS